MQTETEKAVLHDQAWDAKSYTWCGEIFVILYGDTNIQICCQTCCCVEYYEQRDTVKLAVSAHFSRSLNLTFVSVPAAIQRYPETYNSNFLLMIILQTFHDGESLSRGMPRVGRRSLIVPPLGKAWGEQTAGSEGRNRAESSWTLDESSTACYVWLTYSNVPSMVLSEVTIEVSQENFITVRKLWFETYRCECHFK